MDTTQVLDEARRQVASALATCGSDAYNRAMLVFAIMAGEVPASEYLSVAELADDYADAVRIGKLEEFCGRIRTADAIGMVLGQDGAREWFQKLSV